jgi:hypothetical protein
LQHNNSNVSVPIAKNSEPVAETKAVEAPKPAQDSAAAKETSVSPPLAAATGSTDLGLATRGGITQVLPKIPQAALDTITGRVRINVRVRVDSAGQVDQASLEPPPASKYFTDRVLVAAHAWKFPAGNAPQDWLLHFELMREQTRASAAKIAQ